ncbi:MAG: hypothetical protein EAZ97_09840 [Bacteroidetes bacterium]|nr:MAG: hypothetical protein EAZ97_09840 [Bacteroidota bacterium]
MNFNQFFLFVNLCWFGCKSLFLKFMNFYLILFVFLFTSKILHGQPIILQENSRHESTQFIPFYEDKDVHFSLEKVMVLPDSAYKNIQATNFNLGFSKSAFWFKIQLKNQSNFDDWLLAFTYPPLDSISVYYQDLNKNWQIKHLGDHFPFSSRQIPYHEHLFALPLPDSALHTFYVRICSETTLLIPISVVRSTDFFIKETSTELINISLFSILSVIAIYYLAMYFFTYDWAYVYCMTMIFGNAMNLFSLTGLLQRYFLGDNVWLCNNIVIISGTFSIFGAILFLNEFLELRKYGKLFLAIKTVLLLIVAIILFFIFAGKYGLAVKILNISIFINLIYCLYSSIFCLRKKDVKARYILLAFLLPLLGGLVSGLKVFGILPANLFTTYALNIGLSFQIISIAIAFADRQILLKKQKESAEKQILESKENAIRELDAKVKERTTEIEIQKEEIEMQRDILAEKSDILKEKNDKLMDSIRYAQSIQQTILPKVSVFDQNFIDHFIIFKPKDIVSGDFYWLSNYDLIANLKEIHGRTFFALADCTGHGISGAFMTMIGFTLLNEIVIQKKLFNPAEVLEAMQVSMTSFLKNQDKEYQDVMEIGFCALERISENSVKLNFAGAKRSLICMKNNEMIIYKGSRMSIGDQKKRNFSFANEEIILQKDDSFYLFTDGFQDQNSPNGKKIGSRTIEKIISEIYHLPMSEQKQILNQTLQDHQQNLEQRDDIVFIGFKI